MWTDLPKWKLWNHLSLELMPVAVDDFHRFWNVVWHCKLFPMSEFQLSIPFYFDGVCHQVVAKLSRTHLPFRWSHFTPKRNDMFLPKTRLSVMFKRLFLPPPHLSFYLKIWFPKTLSCQLLIKLTRPICSASENKIVKLNSNWPAVILRLRKWHAFGKQAAGIFFKRIGAIYDLHWCCVLWNGTPGGDGICCTHAKPIAVCILCMDGMSFHELWTKRCRLIKRSCNGQIFHDTFAVFPIKEQPSVALRLQT